MKRNILSLWIIGLCTASLCAQSIHVRDTTERQIALVLSGGGARGAAHIGVIRLLEEMRIPVSIVTGTSMGAIIGALYAIGYTANEMDSLLMTQDWKTLLSNKEPRVLLPYAQRIENKRHQITMPYTTIKQKLSVTHSHNAPTYPKNSLRTLSRILNRPGLIDGQNLEQKFNEVTSAYPDSISYDILPRSFACIATDLTTGKAVIFRSGVIAEAMRASMSIPGVFYPVYKDNQVWVDGGVVNNYPVNVARDMGADIIIGVDLSTDSVAADGLHSFAFIFERLIATMGIDLHRRNIEDTDILIRPQVSHYPVMGFDTTHLAQLVDIGYTTALASKEPLIALKDSSTLPLTPAIPKLQNHQFESTLEMPIQQPHHQLGIGIRMDSEDIAMALFDITINHSNLPKPRIDFTSRLSSQPWVQVKASYVLHPPLQLDAAVKYRFAHIARPSHSSQPKFRYHYLGTDLGLSNLFSAYYDLRIGARYEYSFTQLPYSNQTNSYTNLYIALYNDLFDAAYLPSSGLAYGVEVAYHLKNRDQEGSHFWRLQGNFSAAFPIGKNIIIQPSMQLRWLFGHTIPFVHSNYMGGYLTGRYLYQQLPFAGLTGCTPMGEQLTILATEIRYRIYSGIYLSGIANYAFDTYWGTSTNARGNAWGIGAGVIYNTSIGPLSLYGDWSNIRKSLGAYFSFGYNF